MTKNYQNYLENPQPLEWQDVAEQLRIYLEKAQNDR